MLINFAQAMSSPRPREGAHFHGNTWMSSGNLELLGREKGKDARETTHRSPEFTTVLGLSKTVISTVKSE